MRLADLVLSFPALILAMAIAAALGIGVTNAIIAITSSSRRAARASGTPSPDSRLPWCSDP